MLGRMRLTNARFEALSLSATGSQNYVVSHDGMRFLMLRPQPSAPEPLQIMTSWFEELKRLAPTK